MEDSYLTIAKSSEGLFRDRGSKFLAYAFPIDSVEEIQTHQAALRKLHPKARHHCYAYRFGLGGLQFRANDDGEPSGTAGRPILGRIDSFGLTNVFVVVVRYFGGTLLGASGLINAYKKAAADALTNAEVIERIVEDIYTLSFDYEHMNTIMASLSKQGLNMIDQNFGDKAAIDIAIRKSDVKSVLRVIKAQVANVYLEEVDQIEEVPGYSANYKATR